MAYRRDLWEVAAPRNGVVTIADAEEAGVPAVEVRKLAARGALQGHGHGVYTHRDVPATRFTQAAVAVALAGTGAFLHRESVLDLVSLGQFNPRWVRVGTTRRVRRNLPEWMELEYRPDMGAAELTHCEGVPSTTVRRALRDVEQRMPPDRWAAIVEEALRRDLITDVDIEAIREQAA